MLKKPSKKTLTSAAIQGAAGIAGAKISDGLATLLPEDMKPTTKGLILAGVGIVGAASINANNIGGQAAQAALVGMAVKQGANAVTELLKDNVEPKTDGSKTARFVNAIVGHDGSASSGGASVARRMALNMPTAEFDPVEEIPSYAEQLAEPNFARFIAPMVG